MKAGTHQAQCTLEPRGAYGLEGYQAGETYHCEYRTVGAVDKKPYFRVWPAAGDDYYETCSPQTFHKYFTIPPEKHP